MKPNSIGILLSAVVLSLAAVSLDAQESKVVVVQGLLQNIEWTSPVRVYLDVQNGNGQTERLVVTGDSPAVMTRQGFARDAVQRGQSVIVCGVVSEKTSPSTVDGGGIALMDGRTIYFGGAAADCRRAGASSNQQTATAPNTVPPILNSPVQPFVSSPVTAFGVAPVVTRGGFATASPDNNKPLLLQGVIRSVDWRDPSVVLIVEAPGPDGGLRQWSMIGDSPQIMVQRGVQKDLLKQGAAVVVCGATLQAGRNSGQVLNAGGIAFADGRTHYFGRAAEQCRGTKTASEGSKPKPEPILNSPVQPFVSPPVTAFGVDPAKR